eukprot:gene5096-5337_t
MFHFCLPLIVVLVEYVLNSPVQAARVQAPRFFLASRTSDGCIPTQVHLALGKDPSKMHVSWKTTSAKYQQLKYDHELQSDVKADALRASNAVGYSFLLSERDMCSEPAASNEFMIYLHRAVLTGLEPGTDYRYRIVGADRAQTFRSAPLPGPDFRFTFLGFGDMGDATHTSAKSPGAASTLLRLHQEVDSHKNPSDLILHVGDISYADGDPDIWDSFMDSLEPIASRVPYMVAIGNHEYGYEKRSSSVSDPSGAAGPYQPPWGNFGSDSRGECGVMTARRFHMPGDEAADNAPFWYSFEYGSVHFTVLSSEHALEPGSRQHRWLEDDLESVDRCATPWLVVLLHRPIYVVYPHKSNREVGEHIRSNIEDLLLLYKVDATISGHVHSYYRTCPVRDAGCIPDWASPPAHQPSAGLTSDSHSSSNATRNSYGCVLETNADGSVSNKCQHGVVHFVIGSAGRKLSDVEKGQEDWCAAKLREWGYGRFTVDGSNSLIMEFVGSETGEVLDSVTLRSTADRDSRCDRW